MTRVEAADGNLSSLVQVNEQLVFGLLQAQEAERVARHLKETSELASAVQRSLLPGPCRIPGLNVYVRLIPRDDVGGDFYDILQAPRQLRVTFIIGDVMGNGMPAALMMVLALSHFREAMRRSTSPSRILAVANERLYESFENSSTNNLVSGAVLTLDRRRGSALFARAGNEGLAVYSARDGRVRLLLPHGLVLAARRGEVYPPVRLDVAPGDMLLLFTDGITEARDAAGNLFGTDRLLELVQGRTATTLQGFGDHLLEEVRQFECGKRLRDDALLLIIEITPAFGRCRRPEKSSGANSIRQSTDGDGLGESIGAIERELG